MDEAEDRRSELADKVERNTKQQHEKWLKKYEDSLTELQGNTKCNNIQVIEIPEEEEKEQRI